MVTGRQTDRLIRCRFNIFPSKFQRIFFCPPFESVKKKKTKNKKNNPSKKRGCCVDSSNNDVLLRIQASYGLSSLSLDFFSHRSLLPPPASSRRIPILNLISPASPFPDSQGNIFSFWKLNLLPNSLNTSSSSLLPLLILIFSEILM